MVLVLRLQGGDDSDASGSSSESSGGADVCRNCAQPRLDPGQPRCGYCTAPFPVRTCPTAEGLRRRVARAERERELQKFATSTGRRHEQVERELSAFLAGEGNSAGVAGATPHDIVGYLITKDETGKTPRHRTGCPQLGGVDPTCACPRRAKHSTLVTLVGALRAVFNRAGRADPWNPVLLTGNPCHSAPVQDHLAKVEREEKAIGTVTKRADLIDESAYLALLRLHWIRYDVAMEVGDYLVAAQQAQLWLYWSALWYSGARAAELRSLLRQQIVVAPDDSWTISVSLYKQHRHRSGPMVVCIPAPLSRRYPQVALRSLSAALAGLGLPPIETGYLFPQLVEAEDGSVSLGAAPFAEAYARKAFTRAARDAGLPSSVRLHSFHGSRAAREAKDGVPAADTARAMQWSLPSLRYYTEGRTPRAAPPAPLLRPASDLA